MTGSRGSCRASGPAAWLLLSFLAGAACSPLGPAARLAPDEEEFLSRVRYLITSGERRAFLRASPAERLKLMEKFWAGRDPDPTTEENEFRDEYFRRLEEADRLFSGEGRPGWLTDRGRVIILLGPPEHRETHSGGYADGSLSIRRDTIIWYYRGIPLLFIDTRGTGEFELSLNDLSRLEALQTLLDGLPESKPAPAPSAFLDAAPSLRLEPSGLRTLVLEVPYSRLWFETKDDTLRTSLSLHLTVVDATGRKAAGHARDVPLVLTEKQLLKLKNSSFVLEVPLLLGEGSYEARISLKNAVSGEELNKTYVFVIPRGKK